jgi:hypothetical protein
VQLLAQHLQPIRSLLFFHSVEAFYLLQFTVQEEEEFGLSRVKLPVSFQLHIVDRGLIENLCRE